MMETWSGMGHLMALHALTAAIALVGLAYILWIIAKKETGGIKITGQAISVLIVILVIITFCLGAYRMKSMKGMCSPAKMMKMEMMKREMGKCPVMQQKAPEVKPIAAPKKK